MNNAALNFILLTERFMRLCNAGGIKIYVLSSIGAFWEVKSDGGKIILKLENSFS